MSPVVRPITAARVKQLRVRARSVPIEASLRDAGVHPVLARLYAARGIRTIDDIDPALTQLLPPTSMHNNERAARLLADAIANHERLLVIADYDCDGATAGALAVLALRMFGATVDVLVPDRAKLGYGLTPELVTIAARRTPDLLITVDNGIASVAGVAAANALGIRTLVTDHHLPGAALPAATCIVNPNQPGCRFASKSIAGVGVMFYVLLQLRAELRRRGAYATRGEPNLAQYLDLVALGTVADVVCLDRNNRILVSQGLKRMQRGALRPGLDALFAVAGRDAKRASTFDLGFALGPRLNAAGRLADMHLGIELLTTDDNARALEIARQLDQLNRERRTIETTMLDTALARIDAIEVGERATLALADPAWHAGVVGIVAARIKDRMHRPTFVFAPTESVDHVLELRGSGRSINGFHLRDCLDLMSKLDPTLLLKFGGHAAAAGVTIAPESLQRFSTAFESAARRMLDPATLDQVIETDGPLEPQYWSHPIARALANEVWGKGFAPPVFCDQFEILTQRLVGEKHARVKLRTLSAAVGSTTLAGQASSATIDAMAFNNAEPLPKRVSAAYRLVLDEYNGLERVQLVIEHWQALD